MIEASGYQDIMESLFSRQEAGLRHHRRYRCHDIQAKAQGSCGSACLIDPVFLKYCILEYGSQEQKPNKVKCDAGAGGDGCAPQDGDCKRRASLLV